MGRRMTVRGSAQLLLLATCLSVGFPAALTAQSLAVTSRSTHRVVVIDLATLEVVREFETGAAPHELAHRAASGIVWVPSYGGSGVTEIDVVGSVTRTLAPTADSIHALAVGPGARRLWAASETDSTVVEIDGASGDEVRRWRHGLGLGHMVAASPGGAVLWVPDQDGRGAARIDRAAGEVRVTPLGVRAEAVAVAPDGSEVWMTGVDSDEVIVLDSLGGFLDRFPSGGDLPVKLVMSPDGSRVWVSNNRSGSVAVFDRAARERIGAVAVGDRPLGIAFSEDGARAYVTRPGAAEIVEIDAGRLEILRRIPTPPSPDGLVWLPALPGSDRTLRFPSADGATLYADLYRSAAPEPHGLMLLLHQGGSSGRAEYRNVIPRLLQSGWDALAVDLREGGGVHGGLNRTVQALPSVWAGGYCGVYPDVEAALDEALGHAGGRPVVVVGSSYSGALGLQLAGRRTGDLAGVAAFSPASAGPLADCLGRSFTAGVDLPILVVRPENEAAMETVQEQLAALAVQGHRTFVARPGVHGASMLDPLRVSNAEETWDVFEEWLENIRAGRDGGR